MCDSAVDAIDNTFFCHSSHNAYLLPDDENFDPAHPRRRQLRTDVGSIAYDCLDSNNDLVRLYQSDQMTRFIGEILGHASFYPLGDPLGALSINVFEPMGSHAWHFDESVFSVTLMLQAAESGGHFEYVPNLRSESENNYRGVGAVLDGDEADVQTLPLQPGTLSIFAGRYSMHRVTAVEGAAPRLVAVLCYANNPGVTNSPEVRKLFWGRSE